MMSTVTSSVTGPPAAARAGADLSEARERLGLSLEDVSLKLRIRMPYLEALEQGRISLLPGNAYALAFVRTYAKALGLDAEEMVRRFKTEAAEVGRRAELIFPVPMPERGLPPGAVVLLGLVLAIGAYAGWYRLSGEGRLPAETVTAIPERLASLAEQAVPPPPAPAFGPVAPAAPAVPAASPLAAASANAEPKIIADDAATPANPAPPVAAISPTSAAAAQLPTRPADETADPDPPLAPAVAASPAPDASRIVLRASADAWVLVRDRSGTVLLNRTLKPGETWSVPLRSDLLLTAGNAGGTDILVDGVQTPSLGAPGTVRRDLPLDPDQIKEGRLGAALVPQLAATRPRQ